MENNIQFDKNFKVDRAFLKSNRNIAYVYGENRTLKGKTSAERFRGLKNTQPFIIKKDDSKYDESHFLPEEYLPIYYVEMIKLKEFIRAGNFDKVLIPKLAAGSGNRYRIYEEIIEPRLIKDLAEFGEKVVYLY